MDAALFLIAEIDAEIADRAFGRKTLQQLAYGAVAERDGAILLVRDAAGGWMLPFVEKAEGDGIEALETGLSERTGLDARAGLLYSVYEDTKTGRQHVVYRATLGAGSPDDGTFFQTGALPVDEVKDSAVRELLKRFAAESTLGNFGVYFGNQEKGRVHVVAARGEA